MRKILLALLAPIIFASCSSKSGEVYVVTDGIAPTVESPTEGVSNLNTSIGTYAFSVDIEDKAVPVKFKIAGKTYDISINKEGTYLMNLSSDTIVAGQFEYQSEFVSRASVSSPKLDSIRRANDPLKTKPEVSVLPGKSEILTLDIGCKIYGTAQKAPESIQTKSNEKIPITYQLYNQKQYRKIIMDIFMEELNKAQAEKQDSEEKK